MKSHVGGDEFFVVAMSSNHVNNLARRVLVVAQPNWKLGIDGKSEKRHVSARTKEESARTAWKEGGHCNAQTQLARAFSDANGPCSFVTSLNWKRHHSKKISPRLCYMVASFRREVDCRRTTLPMPDGSTTGYHDLGVLYRRTTRTGHSIPIS